MSRVTSSSSTGTVTVAGGDVNVDLHDGSGNPITSTGGALNVNISGGAATIVNTYNEVTSVPPSVETTVVSYLVNTTNVFLQSIAASGSNIGEIRVYVNATVIDKRYLYYTGFNVFFDYKTFLTSAPGSLIANGDTIYVKAVNNGQSMDTCSFNATIQVAEVM